MQILIVGKNIKKENFWNYMRNNNWGFSFVLQIFLFERNTYFSLVIKYTDDSKFVFIRFYHRCCRFCSICISPCSKTPFIVSTVGTIKSKVPLFGRNHFLYKLRRYFVDWKVCLFFLNKSFHGNKSTFIFLNFIRFSFTESLIL